VYRVPAPHDSHGVVAPYTGAEVLFGDPLTGFAINQRHHRGAAIVTRPAEDAVPDGYDLLFLIRPDGRLVAVTNHSRLAPEDGDTLVLLGPATQVATASPTPSD
jgi:glycine/D-amino acid oxidase-like deaminating enzyme